MLAFWFASLPFGSLDSICGLVNLTNPSRLDCCPSCGCLGGVVVCVLAVDDGVGMLQMKIRR